MSRPHYEPLFEWWEVKWGLQFCCGRRNCWAKAELLFDGQPLCFDCTEALIERYNAIGTNPELRQMLPDLWEESI